MLWYAMVSHCSGAAAGDPLRQGRFSARTDAEPAWPGEEEGRLRGAGQSISPHGFSCCRNSTLNHILQH
jgi:hypothetical protein